MQLLRASKKLVLAAIGLLLALLIVKIVLLVTAKPKITVDYVAEYNRLSRPQNVDPSENAAIHYQEAFDLFVEMPDELRMTYVDWPGDFNSAEQVLLEEWLASNSQSFEYFRIGANKPYYRLERQSKKDNSMFTIVLAELGPLRELSKAVVWDAKLNASKGRFQSAFKDIIDCYRAGKHKCRASLLVMEQHVGLDIKQAAVHNAFIILDKSQVNKVALKSFHDVFISELVNDSFVPSIGTERFFLYDALQRTFIDNGKGTGRLAWSAGFYFIPCAEMDKSRARAKWDRLNQRLYCCFIGPTRNELVEQIEKILTTSDQIMTNTPWQVKNKDGGYFGELQKIKETNFILQIMRVSPESIFNMYHKTRAQREALITALAVLQFKLDSGQFPNTLNELVSTGYLQSVPMDPYSDGPLVYKVTEDDFTLYSVGVDFKDDGGALKLAHTSKPPYPEGYVHRSPPPDIIYWPVQRRDRLQSPRWQKQVERREAAEDANRPKP
jgi:hypothetical protein